MRIGLIPSGVVFGVAVTLSAALSAAPAAQQPAARATIAAVHLDYTVRNVADSERFWTLLGATPATIGSVHVMRAPGVTVVLRPGQPSATTEGSVVNHVAFRTPDLTSLLARLIAAGVKAERSTQFQGSASAYTPDGDRIEIFDNTSPNTGFTADSPGGDSTWRRHNQPVTVPLSAHHIHFDVPEGHEAEAKAWYVAHFGGTPGKRFRYAAIDLAGFNLNFSPTAPQAPTRGRTLDRIGFEVRGLDALMRALSRGDVVVETPYSKANGVATATIVDPWGTRIELTEGFLH